MDGFERALSGVKLGYRIQRVGWNAPNQYIVLQKGYPNGIAINANTSQATGIPEGTVCVFRPYLMLCAADGSFAPWAPTVSDVLAEDWEISPILSEDWNLGQRQFDHDVDWDELDQLRAEYQRCSEDAGQGWIESWPESDQRAANFAQCVAGHAWLAAVHATWPAIRDAWSDLETSTSKKVSGN